MFIRRTKTATKASGEAYHSHRLVASERVGGKVRQRPRLNLGSEFSLPREQWGDLCARIEEILSGQLPLADADPAVESLAQQLAAGLVARGEEPRARKADWREIDVDSLEMLRPRSAGAEQVALDAIGQLGLPGILENAGFNGPQRAAAIANIAGRMCEPGSEKATFEWLRERSALGELMDFDFEAMSPVQLHRASDRLLRHKEAIESALFSQARDLLELPATVTLYDLTNTFFEGAAAGVPMAEHGRSKEKRSDCPLLTLGLCLDESGFVRRSEVLSGNVSEAGTLPGMLGKLRAPKGSLVVMDAGIATEGNIDWLKENGYRYLVVSRERKRDFDEQGAATVETASGRRILVRREIDGETGEVRLRCLSREKEAKEKAIDDAWRKRFEEGLEAIAASLSKKGGTKKRDRVAERVGRLKERCRGIGAHYRIDFELDEKGGRVTALRWKFEPKSNGRLANPGVYCLRSNLSDWSEERLWRTYTMLTDLEAVFRSLKSELGLRPVHHRTQRRCVGHLFISVLACQAVHFVRRRLAEAGVRESWAGLRKTLSVQRRVTSRFRQRDGRTLHVRKATRPDPGHREILDILGLPDNPGGTRKFSA
jgi:transposase